MEYGDTTVSLCTIYGSTNAQQQIFCVIVAVLSTR